MFSLTLQSVAKRHSQVLRSVYVVKKHYISGKAEKPFRQIDGQVDTSSQDFQKNKASCEAVIKNYLDVHAQCTAGGGPKALEKHTKYNKKLPAWERLSLLFDDYEDVLEISPLSGLGMEYGSVPRSGVIAGTVCAV